MKLTGHKTESVYRRYAIVSEADLADAVRKLAAFQELGTKRAQRGDEGAGVTGPTPDVDNATQTGIYRAAGDSGAMDFAAALPATHPVDQAHWKL